MATVPEPTWVEFDEYTASRMLPYDDALSSALRASQKANLPSIQVSPAQGKLLHILARSVHAKRILEIGTLGGYSTIWLAQALPPGGRMVSLEIDPRHREVAESNLERAGLADRAEVRLGPAVDLLKEMVAGKEPSFDFVFIDANKDAYSEYLDLAVHLAHPGTLIVIDNVVRGGAVADAHTRDPLALGVRRMNDRIAAEPRLTATTVQTVGVKGYDGFTIALVQGQ